MTEIMPSKNRIIIVFGGHATGKTANAEALKRHYKCRRVVDGWDEGVSKPLKNGDLALTNVRPINVPPNAKLIDIKSALSSLKAH